MCRPISEGGRRCPGGWCAEDRRAAQRRYTARVRAWRREERAALAEIDDEQTRQLLTEALRSVVLTPDERSHLRSKRITRIKRQATAKRRTPTPDPDDLTDDTQPAPDGETVRQALLSDPERAGSLARALARRTDLTPAARSVVAAATAADASGGEAAVPFLDRVLSGAESRSPEDAAARGRAVADAAREWGSSRDADRRVDAAAQQHDSDTGGADPAAELRGDHGGVVGGDRPGGSVSPEAGRLGGVVSAGPAGDAPYPAPGHPDSAPSTPVADALAGVPGVGPGASPEEQRRAAGSMVRAVQGARPAGRPFIPSPADVGAVLRRLLGIGSRLSPKIVVLLAARAVSGLITGDDSAGQMTGADGSGTIWLDMNQADMPDIEQRFTDPRSERFTVGPAGEPPTPP